MERGDTMFAWIVIVLLGVFTVGSLLPRQHPQNHPKAGQHYCYPVFALLSGVLAIFLVITQFAHVSFLASLIFWVTWGLCLMVVALFARKDGFWGTLFATVAALAIVLSPIGLATSGSNHASDQSASHNIGGDQAKAAAAAGTGTKPDTCDQRFVQKWDANTDYRLASAGLWDNPATHAITVKGAAERQKALAGHDARYLASSAWSIELWDDPNKVAPLLTPDKTCLSTQGSALYDKLVKAWDSASAEITQAPANGVNTGSNDGTFVVNASAGINGDRTSIKRTYPSGKVGYDLARCGNHVLPAQPKNVPHGKTNVPPPVSSSPTPSKPTTPPTSTPPTTAPPTTTPPTTTPPTTTPPTTTPPTTTPPTTTPPTTTPPTCPPGQTGTPPNCLQTKGPVPYPTDKSPAPAPSGPAETTPPVETHPADPSTKPGSEPTGVPAPGASKGPTTPVTQPPVTGAPPSNDPGTGIQDPDGGGNGGNAALGALALPFLGLGLRIRGRRNRI